MENDVKHVSFFFFLFLNLNSLLNNFFFLYIICRKIFLLLNLIFGLCLAEDIELYEVSDAAWKNYKSQYNKLYTVEEEPIRYFFYYFVYNLSKLKKLLITKKTKKVGG